MRHCKTALLFVIISLAIFLPVNFAEALKSSGNLLPQTNSQMVCGVHICESPMSIQEKIMMYLFGTVSDDGPSESPVFSFGGVLATYCNDMTIDELITSGLYAITDNRQAAGPQNTVGTGQNDLYLASPFGDIYEGELGDDCIIGNSGRDTLKGRQGNDMIFGGGGNDELRGNNGNDYLDGGAGRDYLNGGMNNDICIKDGEDTDIRNCEMIEITTTGEMGEPQTTGEIIVTTRAPSYIFDDTIRVEGTVLGVNDGRVDINIMDPSGTVIATDSKSIRSDSTFSEGFDTDDRWTLSGTYTVEVTFGTLSGQTTFSFTGSQPVDTGEPITVTTRNPSYTFGQSIRVDGSVPGARDGRVTINIMDPSGAVAATDSKSIRSDGTFSENINTNSGWTLSGTYTVEVTFGTLSGQTTFSFTGSQPTETPPAEEPPGETQSPGPTTPVLESAYLDNSLPLGPGYVLSWSLPPSSLGTPDGGYDTVIDGVDDNAHRTTELQIEITDIGTSVAHCFSMQARWTQVSSWSVSNEICVPPSSTTPPPEEPPAEEPPSELDSTTDTTPTTTPRTFDLSGHWTATTASGSAVEYTCFGGIISTFNYVNIIDNNPTLTLTPNWVSSSSISVDQKNVPKDFTLTEDSANLNMIFDNSLASFTINGNFVDENTFQGTMTFDPQRCC